MNRNIDFTIISDNITSGVSNIYNWWYKDKLLGSINQLSDNQILNIANDINSIFSETTLIENKPELTLPRLVVVGTQSSGKSSVLNGIMAMDILPTGKNMVTRSPLDIRLYKLINQKIAWVEFGHYEDGWITDQKIDITIPTPTQEEISNIRKYISNKTIELAGPGMNITMIPIIIKIYSPYVPNLSLIDLPGLTMVACIDKGQPEDIKDRIEELVVSYIKQERTIIIAVMQARNDLETDLGLALIKKHDANGQRTIGVLTKPDLMNYETHIGEYLVNNISKNLMLTYGYYVVKNRNNKEMETINIFKGFELEKNYFINHNEYNRTIYKDRIGITNLTTNLSKILISSITEMIPSVMTEIISLQSKINQKLEKMGDNLPVTSEGKMSLLNKYVSNFYYRLIDSIESRGNLLNVGKTIKDIFITYRKDLHNIHPFLDREIYDNEYFNTIIASFEGNHMSFYTPPIQILEACITDNKLKPILKVKDVSMQCVDLICDSLINIIRDISFQDEFAKFPQLINCIIVKLTDDIIAPLKIKTKTIIIDMIKIEEDYMWTDNKKFHKTLMETTKNSKFDSELIRILLESYFSAIKEIIAHIVPKIIMSTIIREIENMLLSYLFQNIVTDDKISLLKEDEKIEKQRIYYSNLKTRIQVIKHSFSNETIN